MTAILHRLPNRSGYKRRSPSIHNMFGALGEFERLNPLLSGSFTSASAFACSIAATRVVCAIDGPERTVLWEIVR